MSDSTKVKLISAANTFVATFVSTVGATLVMGGIQWTTSFWFALLLTGSRTAIKEVVNQFLPVRLGGVK